NVLAEVEDHRNVALTVEDAAGTDGVAHALVDAVLERDVDVGGEGFEPAHAHAAHDVARPRDGGAAISGRGDLGGQVVDGDDRLDDLPDHVEVVRIDVGERELDRCELGDL